MNQEAQMADDWRINLAPPWRERMADGTLGEQYGPKTIEAFARHLAAFRLWTWRPPSKEARRDDAAALCAYMRPGGSELRCDVPESERGVYVMIYEKGHSVRYTAREMGLHRSTVRGYLRRLRARL